MNVRKSRYERKIGFVMFTVDCEANLGGRRTSNEELAAFPRKHNDIMIAFAGIDPHKDRWASGMPLDSSRIPSHSTSSSIRPMQVFCIDRLAYPPYEWIAEHRLTAVFHSGHRA